MDLRINENTVIENCAECGKEYETMKSLFGGLYSEKCWVCRICERIDAIMYHFGVE